MYDIDHHVRELDERIVHKRVFNDHIEEGQDPVASHVRGVHSLGHPHRGAIDMYTKKNTLNKKQYLL